MINRIYQIPEWDKPSAEMIKIQNLFETYPNEAQLFIQNESGALIFLLDFDAVICGDIKVQEVKPFLNFLRPKSVFSSADNLKRLFVDFEEVNVLINKSPSLKTGIDTFSDRLSSREAFDILSVDEFDLPNYEHFATDYCRRLNHEKIKVFAKRDKCIAITLETEKYRMIGGIASRQKGLGGALLIAASKGEKSVLCVAKDELLPFYERFGFEPLYKAGYWRIHN